MAFQFFVLCSSLSFIFYDTFERSREKSGYLHPLLESIQREERERGTLKEPNQTTFFLLVCEIKHRNTHTHTINQRPNSNQNGTNKEKNTYSFCPDTSPNQTCGIWVTSTDGLRVRVRVRKRVKRRQRTTGFSMSPDQQTSKLTNSSCIVWSTRAFPSIHPTHPHTHTPLAPYSLPIHSNRSRWPGVLLCNNKLTALHHPPSSIHPSHSYVEYTKTPSCTFTPRIGDACACLYYELCGSSKTTDLLLITFISHVGRPTCSITRVACVSCVPKLCRA